MYNDYKVYKGVAVASDLQGSLLEVPAKNTENILKLGNEREMLVNERACRVEEHEECKKNTTKSKFIKIILKLFAFTGLAVVSTAFLFSDFFVVEPVFEPTTMCLVTRGYLFVAILLHAKAEFKRFLKDVQNRDGLALDIKFLTEEIARVEMEIEKRDTTTFSHETLDTEIVSLREYNEKTKKKMHARLKRIHSLGVLKDELVKIRQEDLEYELKKNGFFNEELQTAKRYVMEMKNDQNNKPS